MRLCSLEKEISYNFFLQKEKILSGKLVQPRNRLLCALVISITEGIHSLIYMLFLSKASIQGFVSCELEGFL